MRVRQLTKAMANQDTLQFHPRLLIVRRATSEIGSAVNELWRKHELTALELGMIMNELAQDYLIFALRQERHPDDPRKKADEA